MSEEEKRASRWQRKASRLDQRLDRKSQPIAMNQSHGLAAPDFGRPTRSPDTPPTRFTRRRRKRHACSLQLGQATGHMQGGQQTSYPEGGAAKRAVTRVIALSVGEGARYLGKGPGHQGGVGRTRDQSNGGTSLLVSICIRCLTQIGGWGDRAIFGMDPTSGMRSGTVDRQDDA